MRISADRSIPEHFESVPLRIGLRAAGWLLAGAGIVGGFSVAATFEGAAARLGGPLLVLIGGIALAAVRQCRAFEITVGTKRIELGAGPFRETVPSGAVEAVEVGPATGWRKLYSDREVTLRHAFGSGVAAAPSSSPEEIVEVVSRIGDLAATADPGRSPADR